jgi:uncharacterized membrane protein
MTDDQQTPLEVDAVAAADADDSGATVVAAVGDETGVQAAGAVVTDYDYAVIVAAFDDEDSAKATFEGLKDAESSGSLGVEGVLVIKTDDEGKVKIQKMTDHSTKTGVKWGAVGGVLLGIFFPPTIIAGAVGAGAAGGVLGKLRQEWHKAEAGAVLTGGLGPNQSGIIALIQAKDVDAAKAAMPNAKSVRSAGVDDTTAASLKEAAAKAS